MAIAVYPGAATLEICVNKWAADFPNREGPESGDGSISSVCSHNAFLSPLPHPSTRSRVAESRRFGLVHYMCGYMKCLGRCWAESCHKPLFSYHGLESRVSMRVGPEETSVFRTLVRERTF